MTLPIHVALVPFQTDIDPSELTRVAAALSKQVERDFQPIWSTGATVDAFIKMEDVPIDYWTIWIAKEAQQAGGIHEDQNGQPYAIVGFEKDWSLTASHELLEMLADPFGKRLTAGDLLDQAIATGEKAQRVLYLLEVCDPSGAPEFSYLINGVIVSDFCTPNYFDPVKAPGVRYSFTGSIDAPRQVLRGGYISWQDPISQHWFQLRMFADQVSSQIPHVLDVTEQNLMGNAIVSSIRVRLDRVTKSPTQQNWEHRAKLTTVRARQDGALKAQAARAETMRRDIERILSDK